jgi:hypothetical protein
MLLLSPAWLWLLVPWVGLVVLTLLGFRPKVAVPFLDLWPRELPAKKKKRGIHPPALPLVLLLLAMLSGIVGLCRPVANSDRPVFDDLTVAVDRGRAMMVGGRLEHAAETAARLIKEVTRENARIRVAGTDGSEELVGPAAVGRAIIGPGATTLDQDAQLRTMLQAELSRAANGGTPVLVVSDRVVPQDERVLPIRPTSAVANVGFVSAVADGKRAMYTLRNDSNDGVVSVQVRAGDRAATFREELPPRGQTRSYTREAVGWPVRLSLVIHDDFADDDVNWVFPANPVARVTVLATGQGAIEKVASAYMASRGTLEEAPVVSITAAPAASRAAILAPTAGHVRLKLPAALPDHPILRNLKLPEEAAITDRPLPPGDWQTLLQQDSQALLAVDGQHKRVWIGFASFEWERTPDFVVFWTNVIDYLAEGAIKVSGPEQLDGSWKRIGGGEELPPPLNGLRGGLYARGDELRVINVPAPEMQMWERIGDVRERLLEMAQVRSRIDLGRYGWVAAAVLTALAIALVAWPRGTKSSALRQYQHS